MSTRASKQLARANTSFHDRPPGGRAALTTARAAEPLFTYPDPVAYATARVDGKSMVDAVAAAAKAAAGAAAAAEVISLDDTDDDEVQELPAANAVTATAAGAAAAVPVHLGDAVAAASTVAADRAAKRLDAVVRRAAGSVTVNLGDHAHLDAGAWLNDSDIDWWMTYLLTRRTVDDHHRRRFHFASSFFFRRLALGTSTGWQEVARWTQSVDIFGADFMLAPCNDVANIHWSLLVAANLKQLDAFLRARDTEIRCVHGRPGPSVAANAPAAAAVTAAAATVVLGNSAGVGPELVARGAVGSIAAATATAAPQSLARAPLAAVVEPAVAAAAARDLAAAAPSGVAAPLADVAGAPVSAALPLVAPRQPLQLVLPWEAYRPALVIMDSLYRTRVHNHVSMSDALRSYLQVEWEMRRNMGERVGGQPRVLPPDAAPDFVLSPADMPLIVPRVTLQPNGCDCGVNVLKNAERLLDPLRRRCRLSATRQPCARGRCRAACPQRCRWTASRASSAQTTSRRTTSRRCAAVCEWSQRSSRTTRACCSGRVCRAASPTSTRR